MKPGRELDILIAEKVIGEKVIELDECNGIDNLWLSKNRGYRDYVELPCYSTEIASAWEVVNKLILDSYDFNILVWKSGVNVEVGCNGDLDIEIGSDSLPHAICLAALKAVGHET